MKIAITTLGCKINQYDSAVIQSRLAETHSFVPFAIYRIALGTGILIWLFLR